MSDIAADIACRRSSKKTERIAKSKRGAPRRASDPPLSDYRWDHNVKQISPTIVTGVVRIIEFFTIVLTGLLVFAFYGGHAEPKLALLYAASSVVVASIACVTFHLLHLFELGVFFSISRQFTRVVLGWTLAFCVFLMGILVLQMGAEFSRDWLLTWFVSGLAAVLAARTGFVFFVRYWSGRGMLSRRALIVGAGEEAERLIEALEASSDSDISICGIFDDRQDDRATDTVSGYPVLGNFNELVDFGRKTRIDLLIVTIPLTAQGRITDVLKKLWVLPVDIRLSAHANSIRFRSRSYSYIGNVPFLDLQDKPITDWDYVAKWGFDKLVALSALVALSPIMALTALAVRLDSKGPIFFKQKRYGFNNELIEVYKFRSMYVDQSDADAAKLVTKGDPRVTRVGRFIRKTSLDELPQLFNVLRGELSMVGPRPHATQAKAAEELYQDVVDGYYARHRVKPGITGWAQVNGWRGETDTEEKLRRRVEHDLFYIENWSVLFDMRILVATPFSLLNSENAY